MFEHRPRFSFYNFLFSIVDFLPLLFILLVIICLFIDLFISSTAHQSNHKHGNRDGVSKGQGDKTPAKLKRLNIRIM